MKNLKLSDIKPLTRQGVLLEKILMKDPYANQPNTYPADDYKDFLSEDRCKDCGLPLPEERKEEYTCEQCGATYTTDKRP